MAESQTSSPQDPQHETSVDCWFFIHVLIAFNHLDDPSSLNCKHMAASAVQRISFQ